MTWTVVPPPDPDEPYHGLEPNKRWGVHCPGCGRFAKAGRGEHYYNGTWDCFRYRTVCSQCGELATECV